MDRTLIQEILEVVEQAAIASAKLTGCGLKNEADAAAVEAMRERMGKINMRGRIKHIPRDRIIGVRLITPGQ